MFPEVVLADDRSWPSPPAINRSSERRPVAPVPVGRCARAAQFQKPSDKAFPFPSTRSTARAPGVLPVLAPTIREEGANSSESHARRGAAPRREAI